MKGFPSGIPEVEDLQETFMKKGGYFSGGIKSMFDDDPHPGDKKGPRSSQKAKGLKSGFNKFSAPWLKDFGYQDSYEGFSAAMKDIGLDLLMRRIS